MESIGGYHNDGTLDTTITCVVMELIIDQSIILMVITLVISYLSILCDWLWEVVNILHFVEFATNIQCDFISINYYMNKMYRKYAICLGNSSTDRQPWDSGYY